MSYTHFVLYANVGANLNGETSWIIMVRINENYNHKSIINTRVLLLGILRSLMSLLWRILQKKLCLGQKIKGESSRTFFASINSSSWSGNFRAFLKKILENFPINEIRVIRIDLIILPFPFSLKTFLVHIRIQAFYILTKVT